MGATNEIEEFEFRHRAEMEASGGATEEPVGQRNPQKLRPNADTIPLGDPRYEEEPTLPYVIGKAKQGLITAPLIMSLAGDAVNYPFKSAAGGISKMVGGTYKPDYFQNTRNLMRSAPGVLGYDPDAAVPRDEYGKEKLSANMLGKIAEFGAGNILPGGAVVGSSKQPLVALAKEVAGTVAAAEGATMGGEWAPEKYKTLGEFAGSLTGPMLVQGLIEKASAGGNWIRKSATNNGIGFSKEARITSGNIKAARELQPQLTSPVSEQNLAEAAVIGKKIPGFNENVTLGQLTDSPLIKSRQQHYGSTNAEALSTGIEKQAALKKSIDNYSATQFPVTEGVNANQGIQRKFVADTDALTKRLNNLIEKEKSVAGSLPRGDMETLGAQIRETRNRLMETAKVAANSKYNMVYEVAEKTGLRVNMDDVATLAQGIRKDTGRVFQDDPGVIGKIINRYSQSIETPVPILKTLPNGKVIRQGFTAPAKVDATSDFREFHSLYKEANAEAGQLRLAASMGDKDAPQKLRQVEAIRDILKAKVTQMEGPEAGAVGSLLKEANSFYANKYQALFKTGVGGEIGKTGKFGVGTENAKLIDSLIMKPGDASGVREYLSMAQGDATALRSLEAGVMDKFTKEVVKDAVAGKVSQGSINAFLTKYKEPLELMPGIRQKISNVDQAMRAINTNRQTVIADSRALATDIVSKMAKAETPEKTIELAFSSPSNMVKLIASSSPDERNAIAKLVMEKAVKSGDPETFVAKNKAVLSAAMGKSQMDALNTIIAANRIAGRVDAPTHLAFQKMGDPLSEKIGTSIPQAISEQKGVTNRFASPEYAVSRVAMRWWNKQANEQKDKIMMEAIYNPEMAVKLSQFMKTPTRRAAYELNAHLIPYGIRSIYESEQVAEEHQ